MHNTFCIRAKSCGDISVSCLEICGRAKADKPHSATSHHSVFFKGSLGKLWEDVGAGFRQNYWIPNLTPVREQDQQLETPAEPAHPFGFLCQPWSNPWDSRHLLWRGTRRGFVVSHSTAWSEEQSPSGYSLLACWEWQRRSPGAEGRRS